MSFDPLSDVLRAVRVREALFIDVELSTPWVAEALPSKVVGPTILPGCDHVIEYHVVTGGECWASLYDEGFAPVHLSAGDVVAFPQGDPHILSSAPGMRASPDIDSCRPSAGPRALPAIVRLGGGGPERGHIVCGFLGFDVRPFNPLLNALPRMMHMRSKDSGWIDRFAEFAKLEANEKRMGGASMLAKLSEIMFIDLVRHYLAGIPEDSANWLTGLKDRHVRQAVDLLHQSPAKDWTLEGLARDTGLSRSTLAERFMRHVGKPPMQYLTLWRMQLASGMLADGDASVARIGTSVGYDSEAAFSRAFKRAVGDSPTAWRERRRQDGPAAPPAR
ncbi:MAG: AraC family transcriptional regulator [Proteobacteria bacterium]|nr:AraC family transcriptional regulator [Pseudomonadota bacterium]